ncbi:protein yellow-like [Cloeon dipterum]|uniref:protein yellow-like n=1 Tax=Cloeon dipterum TaxID=197152 RepID=UPI0032207FD2
MSAFVAAIFLLGLCLANAINFTTVYEWDKFDFIWPSGADTSTGQIKDEYRPENVHLQFMAVFGQRLFLSINMESGIPSTLLWLPTSGTSTAPPKLAPFPSWHLYEKDNCDTIQAARGMEMDTDGQLWVLDDGSSNCSSKIWIFNLVNNDTTERVHQFPPTVVSNSINDRLLLDIVLDKTQDDYFAYITDLRSDHITVYSLKMDKSWTVATPGRRWISLALSPNREARQLFLGRDRSKELYSVSVSELKNEGGNATVKLIGEWSGTPYRMVIDSGNLLYGTTTFCNYLSKWNISEPFAEQRFHEFERLDAYRPFTLALDKNGNLWMTDSDESSGWIVNKTRHKLLKAAVGASTVSATLDETSAQQEIIESSTSSLREESTPPPSLKTGEAQSLLGVFFINLSPQSKFIGKTQPRPQSSISLPFLILLQTCRCVADPENGKNANLYQVQFEGNSCGTVRFPGQ